MDKVTFKGDQNLAWDAVPTDYWLVCQGHATRFFIQDEKLGTPDFSVKTDKPFQISTDYCNKNKGIVWVHQDVSVGPFYVLPVEPKEYKHWGFHFKHLDENWDKIVEDFKLQETLAQLGVRWVKGRLPKAFSESENYFGLVPTTDDQRSISSYKLEPELVKTYAWLFLFAYRGALRTVPAVKRQNVRARAKLFHNKAAAFLNSSENATISDLQLFIWNFMWLECLGKAVPQISKASDIFKLTNAEISNITLTTLLCHPKEFEEAYNEALTKAKLPLKRLKLVNDSMELPYFLQCDDDEGLVRWRVKAFFEQQSVELVFSRGQRTKQFDIPKPISRANIANAISQMPCCISLVGKAGPLITELSRPPSTIALPEKGSKYTPMIGHLTRGLQARGVDFPDGKILRIGMDALDRLELIDEDINLPDFLACFYGKTINGKWFAANWRQMAYKSERILQACHYHPSQLVSVARFVLHELEGTMPNPLPDILKKLGDISGISKPVTPEVHRKLKSLMKMRETLMETRRNQREKFENVSELKDVTSSISMIVAGTLKRHAQHTELFYLNRRPYAFSFWLCFGGEIVEAMGRMASSRVEEC